MNRRLSLTLAVTALAVAAMMLTAPETMAQTMQRPIGDWLAAQGQGYGYALDFPADYLAFTGRDPGNPNAEIDKLIVVDYAGIDAAVVDELSEGAVLLYPQISGSVTERVLQDGRTEVHIRLQAGDALTYVLDLNSWDVIFGANPVATAQGAEPGLGQTSLQVKYIVDRAPGETMEDVMEVIFFGSGDLTFVSYQAVAFGPLADGSPGTASSTQTAPISAAIRNGFKGGLSDGFPVEMIRVQEIGN
jgi:hypothetical protein